MFRQRKRIGRGAVLLTSGLLFACGSEAPELATGSATAGQQDPVVTEPGESQTRMAAEEIPAEFKEPVQTGASTAQSFNRYVDHVAEQLGGKQFAPPRTLAALTRRSSKVVRGTVTSAAVEPAAKPLTEGSEAKVIELVVEMRVDDAIKGVDSGTVVWREPVWSGDPVLSDAVLKRERQELGEGPIGSEILIFGKSNTQAAGVIATDGLISDVSGTFRLVSDGLVEAAGYLTDISSATTAARQATG